MGSIASQEMQESAGKIPLLFEGSQKELPRKLSIKLDLQYPMYLIHVPRLLRFKKMETHKVLRRRHVLQVWVPALSGRVIFISHEWLGFSHPDPQGKQLCALQGMFRMLMDGTYSKVESHAQEQSNPNKVNQVVTAERWAQALPWMYVWFDFMCIPQTQGRGGKSNDELLKAVESVPAYIERCCLFLILAPLCHHIGKDKLCSYGTWRARGWCRLEMQVALLADTQMRVMVCEGLHTAPYFIKTSDAWKLLPGDGDFTCCEQNHIMNGGASECDRFRVQQVLTDFIFKKTRQLAKNGFLNRFRQLACLVNWLAMGSSRGGADANAIVAKTSSMGSVSLDLAEISRAWSSPVDRLRFRLRWAPADETPKASEGRSILYYAALCNDDEAVLELLQQADAPHIDTIVVRPEKSWGERAFNPLMAAMVFGTFRTVEVLLEAGADVNIEIPGGDAFTLACTYGRWDNVQEWLLYYPSWDVNWKTEFGTASKGNTALMCTAQNAPEPGAVRVAQALLESNADVNAKNFLGASVLHCACTNVNAVVDLVNLLLNAHAELNYQASLQASDLAAVFSNGCTALMLAVQNSKAEEARLLIQAQAELFLRNASGMTTLDVALESFKEHTPPVLLELLGVDLQQAPSVIGSSWISCMRYCGRERDADMLQIERLLKSDQRIRGSGMSRYGNNRNFEQVDTDTPSEVQDMLLMSPCPQVECSEVVLQLPLNIEDAFDEFHHALPRNTKTLVASGTTIPPAELNERH